VNVLGYSHHDAADLGRGLIGVEAHIGQAVEYGVQGACHFDTGQMLADADMGAEGERKVAVLGLSENVETVGVVESLGVAVGGAGGDIEEGAGRNPDTAELDIARSQAGLNEHGAFPT
jgi:hypothetical protein